MFTPIGPPELLILLVIVILIFGVSRLPEIGAVLGTAIGAFRRAPKNENNP